MTHRLTAVVLLAVSLLLSGCDSAEERAEAHFQTGLELMEAGDTTRAMLEMRNALQLVPEHEQARLLLANMNRDTGNLPRAVAQYRQLVEYYPENGEGNLALAEIAIDLGDWESTKTYTETAATLLEDSPRVAALQANLAYRAALEADDRDARDAALADATALLEADPTLFNARRLMIDGAVRIEDWTGALALVDTGLEQRPNRYDLYQIRLGMLEQLGRTTEITAQLEDMVPRFPDKTDLPLTLVRWYVQQEQPEKAEAFLRARAGDAPGDIERQKQLVQFINETRGYEAAAAELARLVDAAGPHAATFAAIRANLMFQNGEREAAVAEMEALLASLTGDTEENAAANDVRVDLARMKLATGDTEAAQALVDAVLASDPSQVAALKMRAAWQIEDDRVEEAIVNLRSALRESPRDAQIMTLMAAAHERAGEPQLQREMLALAVETSNSAPAESLRYAQFLIADGRYRPAEDVLIDALRLHRDDVALYAALGQVYIGLEDWPRAQQVADTLSRLSEESDNPAAKAALNSLKAQLLASQKREDELFDFLDELSAGNSGLGAEIAIIRAHAARGEFDEARTRLDAAMEANPDTPLLQFLSAALLAAENKPAEAETALEALLAKMPQAEQVWMALYRMKLLQGDQDGAAAVLDRALTALPDGSTLLFSRAGELEATGDVDGAIGIYETLYERNSSNEIVANNLASLLSMYRDDPETLDRAYRIGRRLQDSKVPAFRDTYGWIAARKGEFEEAEKHLKVALDAYPGHPVVQYHYAVALTGLGRNAEALEHFKKAEAQAGDVLPPADLDVVKAEIARLEAPAPDTAPETAPQQ